MSEAEDAWLLCRLLQTVIDNLWNHYESAFSDFEGEEGCKDGFYQKSSDTDEHPF